MLSSLRPPIFCAAAAVAATALQALRLPDTVALNTVWAEDGAVFLAQSMSNGVGAILTPYQGYLHIVPRLLAVVAAALPLRDAAFVFGAGSALIVALLALFVYFASATVIRDPLLRAALAVTMALVPVVGLELEANAANLHWYLDFAAAWALLWTPRTRTGFVIAAVVTAAAGASDPLAALFLPIGIVRFARGPRRQLAPALAGLGLGLALQLPFVLSHPIAATGHPSVVDLGKIFAAHVVLPMLLGGNAGSWAWANGHWIAAVLAGAAFIAGLAMYAIWRRDASVGVPLALVASAILFAVVEVWVRWNPILLPMPGNLTLIGARYWAVPQLLLWSTAALIAAQFARRGTTTIARWLPSAAVVLWLGLLCVSDFRALNPGRDSGPFWSTSLRSAQASCHRGDLRASITIPPSFTVLLPCASVLSG